METKKPNWKRLLLMTFLLMAIPAALYASTEYRQGNTHVVGYLIVDGATTQTGQLTAGKVTANQVLPVGLAVSYAASVSLDTSANNDFVVSALTGNITIAFTSYATGQSGRIFVVQDGTGGRTVTFTTPGGYTAVSASTDLVATTTASAMTEYYYEFTTVGGVNYFARSKAYPAPSAIQLTGDVTTSACTGGNCAATIAANVVTNADLATATALTLKGRSANSTGNVGDISATAASDCVFRESGSALACGTIATAGISASAVTAAKIATAVVGAAGDDTTENIIRPLDGSRGTSAGLVTNTGYCAYLKQFAYAKTINHIFVATTASGAAAGANTSEVGVFSTPLAPTGAGQTLTKICATGSVTAMTSNSTAYANSSALGCSVAAGTFAWLCIRTAYATTQPTLNGVGADYNQGAAFTVTTPGALTGLSTMTGVMVTNGSGGTFVPEIIASVN